MKHSETLTLTEAIGALWDEDPELHEQLLIHRLKELLPEIIGPAYRWVLSSDVQDETLYLRTSSSTIAQDLRPKRRRRSCRFRPEIRMAGNPKQSPGSNPRSANGARRIG